VVKFIKEFQYRDAMTSVTYPAGYEGDVPEHIRIAAGDALENDDAKGSAPRPTIRLKG
jgi:hypothetical protein